MAGVAGLYAGCLLVWHGLRFTPAGTWWPFELVDIFGVWLYAPLPLLVVGGLLARSRPGLLWLGAVVMLFGWEYGWLFVPRGTPPAFAGGTPLRIMSTNVLYDNGNLDAIVATIVGEQPDVVAIQELGHEQAAHLEARLGDRYPFRVLEPNGAPFGLGIISRHPLRRDAPDEPIPNACACQRLRMELGGRQATVLHVHPPPPAVGYARLGRLPVPTSFSGNETEATLRRAFRFLDEVNDPTIVLGDFNTGDRQPFYRTMRRELGDAYRAAGWGFGFTFPNVSFEGAPPLALVRIDYILHDGAWAAVDARTGTMPDSDHRYVMADMVLR